MSSTYPCLVNAEPREGDSEPPWRTSYRRSALGSTLIEVGIPRPALGR
ncbi:hypothetical protein [Nocardia sp. NPDC004123]